MEVGLQNALKNFRKDYPEKKDLASDCYTTAEPPLKRCKLLPDDVPSCSLGLYPMIFNCKSNNVHISRLGYNITVVLTIGQVRRRASGLGTIKVKIILEGQNKQCIRW